MMAEAKKDTDDLVLLFQAAQRDMPPLPDGLAARILEDADQVQAAFLAPPQAAAGPGVWRQMMDILGGWPSIGGLAVACAAGLWIGVAPPSFLPDPMQLVTGTQTEIDLFGAEEMTALLSEEG